MIIEEEGIKLEIPKILEKIAFYNPQMKIVRSLNIEIYSAFNFKNFLDLLASLGANSLRVKKELNLEVFANDISKEAVELLKKNAELNNLKINIFNENAKFLHCKLKEKFDIIDIDPFGSPTKFLPYILNFLKKETLLSLTATDTATLSGKNPNTCLRRYGIFNVFSDMSKEISVRTLLTFVILFFSKYNYLAKPIFSYSEKHFVKVYVLLKKSGKRKIDEFLKNVSAISFCKNCLNKKVGIYEKCNCNNNFSHIFPIYIGKLYDEKIVEKVYLNSKYPYTKKIFEKALNDNASGLVFDTHTLAKKLKTSIPSINGIIEKLKEKGIEASKCYLSSTCIRTSSYEELVKIYKSSL